MSTIYNWYQWLEKYVIAHKIISAIVLVVILGVAWWAYGTVTNTSGETSYVLGTVTQGTIVASVGESGQVAANDTLSITPQVSGEILSVNVTPGEQVQAGQLIAEIDPTTQQEAVESAKEDLESAQLSLAELQEPPTTLTLTQQQDNITQSEQSLTTLYQTSFNDVTTTFVDLPSIMSGLQTIDLGSAAGGSSQWNMDYYEAQAAQYSTAAESYRDDAYNSYETALESYNQTFSDFEAATSSPDRATITQLLSETYQTTGAIATAVKSANDLIQFYTNELTQNGATPKAVAATQLASLDTYLSETQTHLTALLNDTNSLQSDQQNITTAEQTLAQTQAGADPLQIQGDQLSVTKAQEALSEAQTTLAEYWVYAPFAGTIASVPVAAYDQAGSGTTLATLQTNTQYANLSVNEVDAAKLQLGQKATLTFDALPNLTMTGTVAQISPAGTVTSGVVTYNVEVSFDTQNPQVKAGMSVNATIETAVDQNILEVPAGAIKTQGTTNYVQAFIPPIASSTIAAAGATGVVSKTAPQDIPVTVGITDDTNTQILSGLTLGEQIVTRTESGSTPVAAATTGVGAAGARTTGGAGGFGGGAAIRI